MGDEGAEDERLAVFVGGAAGGYEGAIVEEGVEGGDGAVDGSGRGAEVY